MNAGSTHSIPRFALTVPDLPAYDPDDSLPLASACRLGLVPGHDGRRLTEDELRDWARTGVAARPGGPRYLFPTRRVGRERRTTIGWCVAWVSFIAAERAAHGDEEFEFFSPAGRGR